MYTHVIQVLYDTAMNGLAQVCSHSIQLLRKTAEVILLPQNTSIIVTEQAQKLHK